MPTGAGPNDTIQIDVQAEVNQAVSALENLAKKLTDLSGATRPSTDALERTAGFIDNIKKAADSAQPKIKSFTDHIFSLKGAILGLLGVGSVTALLYKLTSAAGEEETSIARLTVALANAGTSYDKVRDHLEPYFKQLQATTTFTDEEAREALARLTFTTQNYQKSLQALPAVMGFAAANSLDLSSAARLVGSAIEGNFMMIGRWLPQLRSMSQAQIDNMTIQQKATLVLDLLNKKYQGLAEYMATTFPGRMLRAEHAFSDLEEAVGRFITATPAINAAIEVVISHFTSWTEALDKEREGMAKTMEFNLRIIDIAEDIALGISVVIQSFLLLKDTVEVVWRAIVVAFDTIKASVGFTVSVLLTGLGYLSKGLEAVGLAAKGSGDSLDKASKFMMDIAKSGRDELAPALDDLKSAWNNLTTEFGSTKIYDRVIEIFNEVRDRLKDIKVNAPAVGEPGKYAERASAQVAQLNKQLDDEIKKLKEQVETFGMSKKEIALWEAEQLAAQGVDKNRIATITALKIRLDELQQSHDALIRASENMRKADEAVTANLEKQQSIVSSLALSFDDLAKAYEGTGRRISQSDISSVIESQLRKLQAEFEKTKDDIQKAFGGTGDRPFIDPRAIALTEQAWQQTQIKMADIQRQGYILQLKNSDDFFERMKGSFLEFADSVKSDTQAIATFWGNVLSTMSQNFSTLLFDVVTGKLHSLLDIAKQTFLAMVKSAIDMFAAIATQKFIINIAAQISPSFAGQMAQMIPGVGAQAITGADQAIKSITPSVMAGFLKSLSPYLPAIGVGVYGAYSLAQGNFMQGIGGIAGAGLSGAMAAGLLGTALMPFAPLVAVGIPLVEGLVEGLVGLFKKQPYYEIDLGHLQSTELKRFATMGDFLAAVGDTSSDIAKKLVKIFEEHGATAGAGSQSVRDALLQAIDQQFIQPVQSAIKTLPQSVGDQIMDAFLNTPIVYKGDQLTMNQVGDKIAKDVQNFINTGWASAELEAAMQTFWKSALTSLGVQASKASSLVDDIFKDFWTSKDKAKIGQEMIATFQSYVAAFNLLNNNVQDALQGQINQAIQLSKTLGFAGLPTMAEFDAKLRQLIADAKITPDTIAQFQQLHDILASLPSALAAAVGSLTRFIDDLNAKITGLGGTAIDTTSFTRTAIGAIENALAQGGLSLDVREQLLNQMSGLVDQFVAEQLAQMQRANEQMIAQAQARIDALNAEKTKIQEAFQARIDALNKELQIAQQYQRLTESIKSDIDNIFKSPNAPLTPTEQINRLQAEIDAAKQQLSKTTDEAQRQAIIDQLRQYQTELFDLAGSAFGSGTPEMQTIFTQVADELNALLKETQDKGDDAIDIQKRIDANTKQMNDQLANLDQQIAKANAQIAALQAQGNQLQGIAAAEARQYYEYIRAEAMKILQARLDELSQASKTSVMSTQQYQNASVSLLTQIRDILAGTKSAQHGLTVPSGETLLAFLHGPEMVVPHSDFKQAMNFYTSSTLSALGALLGRIFGVENSSQNFFGQRIAEARTSQRAVSSEANIHLYLHFDGNATAQDKQMAYKEIGAYLGEYLTKGEGRKILKQFREANY